MRTALIVVTIVFSQTAFAGPLTPPGAPAPTMKTLHEIEPSTPINATNTPGDADAVFVISQSGPYHLTEDVIGEVGKHGIQINTNNVTLDLRGFNLEGVAGSLDGVKSGDIAQLSPSFNSMNLDQLSYPSSLKVICIFPDGLAIAVFVNL